MPLIAGVLVIVYCGKAYVPTQAKIASGAYMDIEPVHEASLVTDDLVAAVNKALVAGHPARPDPTREELQNRKDPLLAATGARNWKAMAREGVSYDISWTDADVWVQMSRLDRKGRWEWDPAKKRILPQETPVRQIVEIVLEDIHSRLELRQDSGAGDGFSHD